MAKNLTTLKSILNNSKIQVTNNALYQTIIGLIEQVEKSVAQINSDIATLKGGGAALPAPGITQLTGDVTAGPGSGSQIATLSNTGVTAGTYGDAIDVSQITVDAKGRISAASNVPISVGIREHAVAQCQDIIFMMELIISFQYFKLLYL